MDNETVRGVCEEMKNQNVCYACRAFADRIIAAQKREMAAKDEEIARLRKDRDYYREMYEALIKGGVVR